MTGLLNLLHDERAPLRAIPLTLVVQCRADNPAQTLLYRGDHAFHKSLSTPLALPRRLRRTP